MLTFKIVRNAFIYMAINMVGSFLPIIAAVMYATIIDERSMTLMDIAGKGEVAIICIPMCITILFTLYQYKKEIGISRLADIVYVITFFFFVIAVGLYAYTMKGLDGPKKGLMTFSTWFLIWTILAMVISKYIEDDNLLNLKDERGKDQDNLEAKFNNTRD